MRILIITIGTLFWLLHSPFLMAKNVVVEASVTAIDGSIAPFNKLVGGDTVFLKAGKRDYLFIRNFSGTALNPVLFVNQGGIVIIDTDHYFGITVQNCKYFRISGTGDTDHFYGFEIRRVANGTGVGIGNLSTNFELDHVSIRNVPIAAIYAKTDPDCSNNATREKFTQYSSIVHDNYIENAGNEGLYIGSTKYLGQTVNCNGRDTLLMPSVLIGVKIYNNIIKYPGWDGIQISSASQDCQVFNNIILYDSQAEYPNQMSGIMLGGGSKCDCYNNYISDGKGGGIENHGFGGNSIYNNIIVNAGIGFAPNEPLKLKHGIYISDTSTLPETSYYLQNNTIIHPKSDGIRFSSSKSTNNLISSNVIIDPGNFDYYEQGNTQFKGKDSYVMLTDKNIRIQVKNNYFSRTIHGTGMAADFSLMKDSPLIDAGFQEQPYIAFDFKFHPRTANNPPDIGAYEYNSMVNTTELKSDPKLPVAFPNPAKVELTIKFNVPTISDVTLTIYNLSGEQLVVKKQSNLLAGTYSTKVDVQGLEPGIYLYSVRTSEQLVSGKFLKSYQ